MQMRGARLEPLSAEHVAGLDALAQDPDVQQNTYVPSPPPADFGTTWLESYERGREEGTREGFAIVDAEDGSFLGIAVAVRIDEEANEAELGYILAPEAARVVADHPVALREHGHLVVPHAQVAEPAVDEEQRVAGALHLVVELASAHVDEPRIDHFSMICR